jgi:hypothetical protein
LRDTQAYKEVMVTYGTGSNMQRGIQAATAALQGLAGGNIGARWRALQHRNWRTSSATMQALMTTRRQKRLPMPSSAA